MQNYAAIEPGAITEDDFSAPRGRCAEGQFALRGH
jgi:hypothetical protein